MAQDTHVHGYTGIYIYRHTWICIPPNTLMNAHTCIIYIHMCAIHDTHMHVNMYTHTHIVTCLKT